MIALSTGEAELYAPNTTAPASMGLKSFLEGMGISVDMKLFTDATTERAMATRNGLGKVRHRCE